MMMAFPLFSKASHFETTMNGDIYSNSILQDSTSDKDLKRTRRLFKELYKLIQKITNTKIYEVSYNKAKFQIVIVNTNFNELKILPNTTGNLQGLDYQFAKNPTATVLMNAGMFESNGTPVGLLISGQKQINKINLNKNLPGNFYSMKNAIFYVDIDGKYYVKNSISFNEKFKNKYQEILYATQSGPILTSDGKINQDFSENSTNKLIRNGIGVVNNSKNNIAIFIIAQTPCSFFDMASLFKYLGCDNSMYLDGTVSSMFYKKNIKDKPKFGNIKLGPVLIVTPKNP